ncbi:hypothetical protein ILUMI_04690 [Ignelater luminosus]|uniref:SIAH-type domain-containing protein n=1 Tax=Ignelater luminosus TaxID=2038154 RepID=A0A8K0DEB7_IGNLU|nr:hypothetical protein ILUMI_04690 [Ignelater luminosus]
MAELNLGDGVMEKFRCFKCKDYLSVSPIVALPNGKSLCGLCYLSTEEITHKELVFEGFLKILLFPCKFKDGGCEERLKFDETQNHHAKCIYRLMKCPVSSSCSSKVCFKEMLVHISDCHSDVTATEMEFTLAVSDKDQSGVLLVCVHGVNLILKYNYNGSSGNLQYYLQHFNTDVQEMKVKITLINDVDSDYGFYLKEDPPSHFNESFYEDFSEIPNSKTLGLNNAFPLLNNPDFLKVIITLDIVKSDESEKQK